MNLNIFRNDIEMMKLVLVSDHIVIYGAGTMGQALYKCLSEEPYKLNIDCFLVKSLIDNPDFVCNVPVRDIENASEYIDSLILVALNNKIIHDAIDDLRQHGFNRLINISFDGDLWSFIRGRWSRNNIQYSENIVYMPEILKNNTYIDKTDDLHVYVAHSIFDRKINTVWDDRYYEIAIQVGAALTDKKMFSIVDSDSDDNISCKNKQYCETTGIFWAWKHDYSMYIGFSHYRRRFVLNPNEINYIKSGNVDIVVTEPILNFNSVKSQYAKDHCAADWDILIEAIEKLSPKYSLAAQKVQNGIYYFAYNMFIMKREVFDKYCQFVFPVLEYCEKKIGVKEDAYQNRYVGFLAERLLSIFIEENNKYKVVIADKTFLE